MIIFAEISIFALENSGQAVVGFGVPGGQRGVGQRAEPNGGTRPSHRGKVYHPAGADSGHFVTICRDVM